MRVYISADYSEDSGDITVVKELHRWCEDKRHIVDFVDMAEVTSGSVSANQDCRACDLKKEFNNQINASSSVIFVVGDKTAMRTAGSYCHRTTQVWGACPCTPYKQNTNGIRHCKMFGLDLLETDNNIHIINNYSYLRHEFEQAKFKRKNIIVVYNSLRKESTWLPSYMKEFEISAQPFWVKDILGNIIGNYEYIKQELGYV